MSDPANPDVEIVELEIPRLPGYMSMSEAGKILGVFSKQGIHRLIFESGEFTITDNPQTSEVFAVGERPMYVVKSEAVRRVDDLRRTQGRWRNHRAVAA